MPNVGVLNHPQRAKIDQMILQGVGDRTIAKTIVPPLSRDTVLRYRRTVVQTAAQPVAAVTKVLRDNGLLADHAGPAEIEAAVRGSAEVLAKASPLIARLESRRAVFDAAIPQALEQQDFRGLSNLLSTEAKHVETIARVAGVIDGGAGGAHTVLNMSVVLPQPGAGAQHVVVEGDVIDVEPASD